MKRLKTNSVRSGFSLVEILVVMGILGILIVLIVTAIGPLLGGARVAATKVTIQQIDDIIQARYNAIRNVDVSVEAKKLVALNRNNSSGPRITTEAQAEFIIRKTLYRQALPQRPQDLFGLDGVDDGGSNDDAPYFATLGNSSSSNRSEELFFAAITTGSVVRALPGGKQYPVPVLELDNINPKHVANTDADDDQTADMTDHREFVDDWGVPLRFYNFPTRLFRDASSSASISTGHARLLFSGLSADTSNTGPLGQDPLDPTGTLANAFTSNGTLNVNPGNSLNFVAFNEGNYHTPNTYYAPLLISAGPDGATAQKLGFGLDDPISNDADKRLARVTAGFENALTDNITNRQQ